MATDNKTVYNALGDLPTNYQSFEDDTSSDTESSNNRAESIKQLYEDETAIVNLCSVVGAVIWQSWQKRTSASKQNNLFNALNAIMGKDKANAKTGQEDWSTKIEQFFNFSWFDKWFATNKQEQQASIESFQTNVIAYLQNIDTAIALISSNCAYLTNAVNNANVNSAEQLLCMNELLDTANALKSSLQQQLQFYSTEQLSGTSLLIDAQIELRDTTVQLHDKLTSLLINSTDILQSIDLRIADIQLIAAQIHDNANANANTLPDNFQDIALSTNYLQTCIKQLNNTVDAFADMSINAITDSTNAIIKYGDAIMDALTELYIQNDNANANTLPDNSSTTNSGIVKYFEAFDAHLIRIANLANLIYGQLLDSGKNQQTGAVKLDISGKETSIAAYDNLIGVLSTLSDKKTANIYKGLTMLNDIVNDLAKINPKFEKVLNQTADIAISVGTKIRENANAIEQLNVLIDKLDTFVKTANNASTLLVKFGASMVAFAGSLYLMSKLVTLESIGLFALSSLALYGTIKLFEKIDTTTVLKNAGALLAFSSSLAVMALTLSLVPKVVDSAALTNIALLGATLVGLIYMLRWAKPAQFGKEVVLLSAGVATLVLAFALGGEVMKENWKDALLIVSFVFALGASIGIANKLAGGKSADGKGMAIGVMGISASIAILALAIWGWHQVVPDWTYAIAPVGCMLALAGAMSMVGKMLGSGKDALNVGIGMSIMSASVGLLALAILPWNLVDAASATKAAVGVTTIGLALAAINAMGNKRGGVKDSAIGLAIASASVALLGASMLIWNKVNAAAAITAGIGLTALTTALVILGKRPKESILGGTALAIAAASTLIFATGLLMIENIAIDSYVQFGVYMTAISAAAIGLGAVSSMALLGAAAMAAVGAATLVFAYAMKTAGESSIEWSQIGQLSTIMAGITVIATGVGNPFTVAFTLAGAAALVVVGTATLQFAKSIKAVSDTKLSPAQLKSIGNSLSAFITTILDSIDNNADKLHNAKRGIESLAELGTLIYNLSYGLKGMADLVFPKYDVKDGKLVITGTIDMDEALPKIGTNIAYLLNVLQAPLADIGSRGTWYSGNDVKKGIKALAGIGDVFVPLADGVIKMSQLQFVKYDVKDGKLVPVKVFTEKETRTAIKNIGTNIAFLLNALEEPLAKIGESGTWFNKNHTKKGVQALAEIGNVFSPITELLDAASKNPNFSNDWVINEFAPSVSSILTTISDIAKRVNNTDEIDVETLRTKIELLDNLVNVYKDVSKHTTDNVKFADSFVQVNQSLDKLNLEKLSKFVTQFKTLQSKSIVDSITGLAQSINGPLTAALEKLFTKLEQAINKLNLPATSVANASTSSTNKPATITSINQDMNMLRNNSGNVKVQTFGLNNTIPDNVSLTEVYAILIEINEALTSTGIRVYN